MITWDRIIDLIKLLKPEFYNKLTWVMVISGVTLVSAPFWQDIVLALIDKRFGLDIDPAGNTVWGFYLIIIGLIYHFSTNSLLKFVEFISERDKLQSKVKHDKEIFKASQNILSEDLFNSFLDDLEYDHAYWLEKSRVVDNYEHYLIALNNQYLDESLNESKAVFLATLKKLMDFVAINFFTYPKNQSDRLCLHPSMNIDRDGDGDPAKMQKYKEYADQLQQLIETTEQKYSEYRGKIKSKLIV